ncbi:aminotransferase [Hyaloraphidium curvatum]|nr:aminotransferase [Hyaloraphidium curvatum]
MPGSGEDGANGHANGHAAKSEIDWNNLGFGLFPTKSHIEYTWKEGKGWDSGVLVNDPHITLHIAATVFHYGQSCFEGMKAYRMKDGKVRIFRPDVNAERIEVSADASAMVAPPKELFLEACRRVIADNIDFVPPYGTGGALYIRPFLFGSGPQVGLHEADEYKFVVFVNPVGDYYKGGVTPAGMAKALIPYHLDRAATYGVGHAKLGGNYSPGLKPTTAAKKRGYTVLLFLDAKTNSYIEEFATSNFIAITPPDANGKRHYATPSSQSILNSVTNQSLYEIAEKKLGWIVERRDISWDEVKSGAFNEVGAVGTAVVVTPISQIDRDVSESKQESVKVGTGSLEGLQALYGTITAMQKGDDPDGLEWGWCWPREGI